MLAPEPTYIKRCPSCGIEIPTSCKCCWSCGKVLDPRLIEPAKSVKESEEITPKTKKRSSEDIIQEWRDYEGTVAKARKPYNEAIAKANKFCKETKP